jgi:hypothetical protein
MNLFYEISCSLAPLAFLLFTFSPSIKRRRSSGESIYGRKLNNCLESCNTDSLLSGNEQQKASTGTTGSGTTTHREGEEQHENFPVASE